MRNTFSSQVKLTFWTDLLLNVISGNCFAFRNKVELAVVTGTGERSPFSGS
jgi:hypothetical protein